MHFTAKCTKETFLDMRIWVVEFPEHSAIPSDYRNQVPRETPHLSESTFSF